MTWGYSFDFRKRAFIRLKLVPDLNTSVFLTPASEVKNREDRLVILNDAARSVFDKARGHHPVFVFTYARGPLRRMNNTAWNGARRITGVDARVHDLKHTFGRRLRASGVSFEDRQDSLGHKSGRITTHYSAAELSNLIKAANRICGSEFRNSPALVLLKRSEIA